MGTNDDFKLSMVKLMKTEINDLVVKALDGMEPEGEFEKFVIEQARVWAEEHGHETAGNLIAQLADSITGAGRNLTDNLPKMDAAALAKLTEVLQAEEAAKLTTKKRWALTLGSSLRSALLLARTAILVALKGVV